MKRRTTDMALILPDDGASASRLRPIVAAPVRPLQFPSLAHFEARVRRAIDEAEVVDGLRKSTTVWAWRSFVSFRRYLRAEQMERPFLGGDVEMQIRVLRGWIAWQRVSGVSRISFNTNWRGLSSALRWIGRVDRTVNPLTFAEAPAPGRHLPRFLTKDVAENVLQYVRNYPWGTPFARSRGLAMLGVMLLAGLRRSEVVALLYADVDEMQGTIVVRNGKGPHGGKTRTCYMPPQLRAVIAEYKVRRRELGRKCPAFFTSLLDDRPITPQPVRRLCDQIRRDLDVDLTPHVLRHTYATLLRQAGVPDRVSMDLLGHASLSMLQRYSHVADGEHLQQASRLLLNFDL